MAVVIKELSPNAPGCPAHVAFTQETAADAAIRAMHRAVHGSRGAFNAAVWMQPSDPAMEQAGAWCDRYGIGFLQKRASAEDGFASIKKAFNDAVRRPEDKRALAPLRAHILARLAAFQNVFPGKDVKVTLNATALMQAPGSGGNPHIDVGEASQRDRYIETLRGEATWLVDNAEEKTPNPAFWRTPTGALTLLTTRHNSPRPVTHAAPLIPADPVRKLRIAVIYDIVDRPRRGFGGFLR